MRILTVGFISLTAQAAVLAPVPGLPSRIDAFDIEPNRGQAQAGILLVSRGLPSIEPGGGQNFAGRYFFGHSTGRDELVRRIGFLEMADRHAPVWLGDLDRNLSRR